MHKAVRQHMCKYAHIVSNLDFIFCQFRGKLTLNRSCQSGQIRHLILAKDTKITNKYIHASDQETLDCISKSMTIVPKSPEEESTLFKEVETQLRKLRYEISHWDDAIHGYRETEKRTWLEGNSLIIDRVKKHAFNPGMTTMNLVHVLDLQKSGYIKPHIDSIRFCGEVIAGISLLSPAVMRLVHDKDKTKYADCLLDQRSLYIMKGDARHEYTHEILKEEDSKFKGDLIPRDRRISIICRCEPNPDLENT